jgi:hypothetical protein
MRFRTLGRLVAVVIVGLCLGSRASVAQSASLIGTVARDTLNNRLDGAEISIAEIRRTVLSSAQGEFRIDGVPAGRYAVTVRHVGFTPRVDTVEFSADGRVERTYVLAPSLAVLDSVRVTAKERKYLSPGLNGFEERRKLGFGHFITDSVLRRYDNDRLSDLLRRISGVSLIPYRSGLYAGSTRSVGGTTRVLVDPSDQRSPKGCWSTIYLDGALIYSVVAGNRGAPVPDYNSFQVIDLGAVEFYSGGATIPVQYNATEYGCGTVLLWTRER